MTQTHLKKLVEAPWFAKIIMILIIINALTLGMETYPVLAAKYGALLKAIDHAILWVFVAEIDRVGIAMPWAIVRGVAGAVTTGTAI